MSIFSGVNVLLSIALFTTTTVANKSTIRLNIIANHTDSNDAETVVFPKSTFQQFYECMCSRAQASCTAKCTEKNHSEEMLLVNKILTTESTAVVETISNFTIFACSFNPDNNMTLSCRRLDPDLQNTSCKTNATLQAFHMNGTGSCDFSCIGILWNNEAESLSYDPDIENIFSCNTGCHRQEHSILLDDSSTAPSVSTAGIISPNSSSLHISSTTKPDTSGTSQQVMTSSTTKPSTSGTSQQVMTSSTTKPSTSGTSQQGMTSSSSAQTSNSQQATSPETQHSTKGEQNHTNVKDKDKGSNDNSSLIVGSVFAAMVVLVILIVALVLFQKKFRVVGLLRKRYEELSVNYTSSSKGENFA